MSQAVRELRLYLNESRFAVDSRWDLFSGGQSKAAAYTALEESAEQLDSLSGATFRRVELGEVTYEQWIAWAAGIRADIAYVIGDSSNWSFFSTLASVATQTAVETKEGADKLLEYLPYLLAVVAVGVALYAANTLGVLKGALRR